MEADHPLSLQLRHLRLSCIKSNCSASSRCANWHVILNADSCMQDSQRPRYIDACILGLLGNKSGSCSDTAVLQSNLSWLANNLSWSLQGLMAERPTTEAIDAGRCAVTCLRALVKGVCSCRAKVSHHKVKNSGVAELLGCVLRLLMFHLLQKNQYCFMETPAVIEPQHGVQGLP